jgi:hypothetical protein
MIFAVPFAADAGTRPTSAARPRAASRARVANRFTD